jgi:DNA adenine methylase
VKLRTVQAHRAATHTPLRYPGGKTRLYGLLRKLVAEMGLNGGTYVEPYAGGAGAALSLLLNRDVQRIVINDLDPAIHAFWASVVGQPEPFLKLVRDTPLTIDEWEHQRSIYRLKDTTDQLRLGFSAFYLNRTNRSGVMNAGVIGGKLQQGTYRIDARYNRTELTRRIEAVAARANDIEVCNMDGLELLRARLEDPNALFYIDPPYFDKGSFLYLNSFDPDQHGQLAALLRGHRESAWVVTYDDVPEIRALYKGMYQGTFELPYSAHVNSVALERMIASSRVARETSLFDR